jgi:hypothetical protein
MTSTQNGEHATLSRLTAARFQDWSGLMVIERLKPTFISFPLCRHPNTQCIRIQHCI